MKNFRKPASNTRGIARSHRYQPTHHLSLPPVGTLWRDQASHLWEVTRSNPISVHVKPYEWDPEAQAVLCDDLVEFYKKFSYQGRVKQ